MRAFLGSSSEAYERITQPLRLALQNAATKRGFPLVVASWRDSAIFRNSEHPVEALRRELKDSEFGIFVFARDDAVTLGDKQEHCPRDNVIFEAGMFVSDLDRDRTFIVVEKGARVLTDYKGLQYLEFNTGNAGEISASCEDVSKKIIDEMCRKLPVRAAHKDAALEGYWLSSTIKAQRERLDTIEDTLLAVSAERPLQNPISTGTEACIDIYTDALGHVTRRFWTTTFFTSGFWLSNAGRVLGANQQMLERVREQPDSSVRRLFLLPMKYESFLVAEGQEVSSHRRLGDDAFLIRKEREIQQVESYIKALIAADCEVRIGIDEGGHIWSGLLTEELQDRADPNDTEIAIYDNARIDMYRGGRTGHIAKATLFPKGFANFAAHLRAAEDYFEALWNRGKPAQEALTERRQTFLRSKFRIDYHSNWLARYEYGLETRDRVLKENELRTALEQIQKYARGRKFTSLLDIGTCTARYPIALHGSGLLADNAHIVGLDEDKDCIDFSKAKLSELGLLDAIRIEPGNFMHGMIDGIDGRKFDLITCMLGTISHFGELNDPESESAVNGVSSAIARMHERLEPGGLLLIGNWSDQARANRRFLRIYTDADAKALQTWTPSHAQLGKMLAAAGLSVVKTIPIPPPQGLDLFVVERKP